MTRALMVSAPFPRSPSLVTHSSGYLFALEMFETHPYSLVYAINLIC